MSCCEQSINLLGVWVSAEDPTKPVHPPVSKTAGGSDAVRTAQAGTLKPEAQTATDHHAPADHVPQNKQGSGSTGNGEVIPGVLEISAAAGDAVVALEPEQDIPVSAVSKDIMRPVRIWLWLLALMVFGMVVVGGATRLTEAGLSITEWKPLTGVLPPLSDAQWNETFNKYKEIPQFKEMFSTMTMAQYKVIYFWEWGHRLLGRLLGVVFLLPFLFFLFTRRINSGLFVKLSLVFALGALQGLIGWWMVKSGLTNRVEVAAERLAIHLLLAAITFTALIWLAMSLRQREPQPAAGDLRGEATCLIVAILIQIGLGGLVAGARAGLTYNTWPLMDGHLVPAIDKLTSMNPLWINFLENPTTLQFQHRMFAYLLVLMILGHAFLAMQKVAGMKIVRRAWALTALVLVQAALGVFTLLHVLPAGKIPLYLALTHQAVAFVLLAMAVVHRAAMSKPHVLTQADAPSAPSAPSVAAQPHTISSVHSGDTAIAT
jgi:heme a synthase